MKLAVIGGGSTYTPELVAGLARERERLDLHRLVLHDIDAERRDVVGGLAARMLAAASYDGELAVTDDLDAALDEASFVLRQLRVAGRDVLPELMAEHGDELAEGASLPRDLLERLGAIPSYYLHYFYRHDQVLDDQRTGKPRAAEVAEIERELLELYRDPNLTTKPKLLERRGGAYYSDAATQLVASLATGDGDVQVVDVRNNGTLEGLADDD